MPQLILIETDLSDGKELRIRQKSFSNGFASVEIDIYDKNSIGPEISFFMDMNGIKDLIKFLTTEHLFTHDINKL